ncbi:hypothetical protein CRUP_015263 [Coryphaenoides rupestris]|nr:hypothetical protein CRUP_015263 [Coryphaenoides rupestris]
MSSTLLMTVKKARRKRHTKDILGCVDSSLVISPTSVTGSSGFAPVKLGYMKPRIRKKRQAAVNRNMDR